MTLKAVLFDLDGTLLDTAPDFIAALKLVAKDFKIPCPSDEAIRQQVSNGGRALTRLLFGLESGENGFDERWQHLLNRYNEVMGDHCVLFDDMADLLKQLEEEKLHWGIITNKPSRFAEPLIEKLVKNSQLHDQPALLLCPDHVANPKPHPEALLLACKMLQCNPAEVVYIGDHKRDIDCGRTAGAKTIAVSYGYIEDDDSVENWRADAIVHSAEDIWPIIQKLF